MTIVCAKIGTDLWKSKIQIYQIAELTIQLLKSHLYRLNYGVNYAQTFSTGHPLRTENSPRQLRLTILLLKSCLYRLNYGVNYAQTFSTGHPLRTENSPGQLPYNFSPNKFPGNISPNIPPRYSTRHFPAKFPIIFL